MGRTATMLAFVALFAVSGEAFAFPSGMLVLVTVTTI